MKQATSNTFTEGLIKDLHPLSTPNTVLTDALNATLLTYDGNEYLLQNDVGNGRVETARLPSGYIPVGMKEYGGIIYVASYNPLLGRSQLGSFPSPERQISTEELGRQFDIISNINTDNAYLRLDIIDTNKKSLYRLNPGDKFIIASAGISKYFGGIYDGILKIHVGIIDKENNLTYIEEDLEEPYIVDTNNIETNTNFQVFTSKTSGYLTIIVELLTIDTFNIVRDISVLSVGAGTSVSNSNPEFALTFRGNYTTSSKIRVEQFKLDSNLGNNIYSTTDLKIGLADLRKSNILDYTITPICKYGPLSSFAVSGKIDFSILGTGYSNLTEWRYYSDNDYLKLNWGLDYDPIRYVKVAKVTFKFYDFKNQLRAVNFKSIIPNPSNPHETVSYYQCGYKDNYNGNFSEKIPYQNKKTVYGLRKNNLYFVAMTVDFLNQSGNAVPSKEYFRLVYTTGIFNENFIKYENTDFKELYPYANVKLTPEMSVDTPRLTPQGEGTVNDILDQIKTDNSAFIGSSVMYNVQGSFDVKAEMLNPETVFGDLNFNSRFDKDPDKGAGLELSFQSTVKNYKVTESVSYLGTALTDAPNLETKLNAKYPGKPYLGVINLKDCKITKENNYKIFLNGDIRRGIIASGTKNIETKGTRWVLTPAVSDSMGLNNYIAPTFVGTPNKLDGSTNHAQLQSRLPQEHKEEFWLGYLKGNGEIAEDPEYGNITKVGAGISTLDNPVFNDYNSSQLKCPITAMITGNRGKDDLLAVNGDRRVSTSIYPVRSKSNGNYYGYYDDVITVLWKTNDYSYNFINLGGCQSWQNREDVLADNAKWKVDGCTYEYPRTIRGKKLTIIDILYNYLSRVYVAQRRNMSFSYKVLDGASIVYHDDFDETFTTSINYNVIVRESSLLTFNPGDNSKMLFNTASIFKYISDKLPQYQPSQYQSYISKNLTIRTNITDSTESLDFTYDVGKQHTMSQWYNLFNNVVNNDVIGEEGADQDIVYIPNSTETKDADGTPLSLTSVYLYKNGKYVKYDGKVDYGNGLYSNTTPEFLVVRRPSADRDAILYINPSGTTPLYNMDNLKAEIAPIDTRNIIFPDSHIFN